MAKEVQHGSNIVINYENLPLEDSVEYLNTTMTLSSLPENFIFIEDPNPPIAVPVPRKAMSISLAT